MKTIIFGAIALAFAVPAAAQTAPAGHPADDAKHEQSKHDCKACCEKMKSHGGKLEGMDQKGHGERGEMHGGDKSAGHGGDQH